MFAVFVFEASDCSPDDSITAFAKDRVCIDGNPERSSMASALESKRLDRSMRCVMLPKAVINEE